MRHLTKTISILALGVSLAFVAPGELPTASNDYSIWAEAEAANIKRSRIKQRNNGLYKSTVTTTSDSVSENGEIEIEDKIFRIDGDFVYSYRDTRPDTETVYFDWLAPEGFVPGPVSLGCQDCGDDGFSDIAIDLSFAPDWSEDDDIEEDVDEDFAVEGFRLGDGAYRIAVSGASKTLNKDICLDKIKGKGLCGNYPTRISVDGSDANFAFVEHNWERNLPGKISKELDEIGFISEVATIGENGEVLDSSTSLIAGTDLGGEELDYAEFRITGQEDSLIVINTPEDAETDATLDVRIESETLGTDIINETAVPATPYREFTFSEVTFIEIDNVVDQTYVVEVAISDVLENRIADIAFTLVGSEAAGTLIAIAETGELQGWAELVLNDDEESFTMNVALLGDVARDAYLIQPFISAEDGGSDPEMEEYNIFENRYFNIWNIPAPAETYEIMLASDGSAYDFRLYNNGELQDVFAGISEITIEIEEAAEFTTATVNDLSSRFDPDTQLTGLLYEIVENDL